ncbi:MAG: methyltransferase domain-containing protein [Aulosira sp. ZfuCHP01]|nr:methyltransferase domain-containing protein [Aulosira sp. ZfuVER01]MDZ8055090.1 methyltransferase domain-containing protein [Aulosira sp. ZfuCHP01]
MYDQEKISSIYRSDEYAKDPFFLYEKNHVENLTKKRYKNFHRGLVNIESKTGVGKLLDVGCGSGAFLSIAQERGWHVDGIELSSSLAQICEQNVNITVTNTSFEEANLPTNYYDAITFWDIIEHVIDPVFCMKKAKTLLKSGGVMLFCTPNEDSLLAGVAWTLYKLSSSYYSYPALALHPDYHTYFFSRQGLIKTLLEINMKPIKSYSQEAFFEHSPLASEIQKRVIALIEKVGSIFDYSYELVILAEI